MAERVGCNPFGDASLPAEEHPIPLGGAHVTVSCEGCHAGEEMPEFVCSNFQERPEGYLLGECDACHTPAGFAESASFLVDLAPEIAHELEGREDCMMCHDPEGQIAPAPENHVDSTSEQCILCHKGEEQTPRSIEHLHRSTQQAGRRSPACFSSGPQVCINCGCGMLRL